MSRASAIAAAALATSLIATSLTAAAQDRGNAAGALARYVAKTDASYGSTPIGRYTYKGTTIVGVHLVSQTWRDTVWQHQLYLIRPERIDAPGHGVLIIGGGRWHESYATGLPERELRAEIEPFVAIARRMHAVVAVVGQVPFQPLLGLTEDRLIAHTLERYLATGDPEWPLLLPMVKSAVRAMDATQEVAAAEWGVVLETFTVFGASKRGWTSWLTAAVDRRVTAVAPIVIDAVNMRLHFPHEIEVWGAPSEEIQPYTDLDLHNVLSSEEGRELREIVDPYNYREMLTQPKLIVVATNDRYFPVDSLNLYWDELVGRKYILYVPNSGHDIVDIPSVVRSIAALNRDVTGISPLPAVAWEVLSREGGLVLCVAADPSPVRVRAWTATAPTRDFRDSRWVPQDLGTIDGESDAVNVLKLPPPERGYAAVFAELEFGRRRQAFALSTNVAILGAPEAPPSTPISRGTPGTCPLNL